MASINMKQTDPIVCLDEFRGKDFSGEWPTLPELFSISVKRYGENACFTDFEGLGGSKNALTYNQSLEKILTLANWMAANGIKHGDHVAVSGKNSPEWAIVYLAALYAGGVIIPIDYALHTTECDNLLNTAKPKIFFVDAEKYEYYKNGNFEFKVMSLNPKFPDTYAYNLKADEKAEITPATEEEVAAILFTSGTTGTPKGVMLTHKNLVSDCFNAQTNMNIYPTDVFYALLPIHHAYTMTAVFIEAISVGAELVFGKSMAVSKLMKELREAKVTMLLGVPLLFNKLLAGIMKGIRQKGPIVYGAIKFLLGLSYIIKKLTNCNPGKTMFKAVLKQANIYTLRIAICGGGPLAPSVFKTYNELGIDFVQGYGLTETSPIIALNPIEHFKINSVGRDFYPYMDTKIIEKEPVISKKGIGIVGEIAVKGPMVMQGYYNMPDETAAMFTEDGYLKTGDLGWMDSERYIMLCGRAKNLIVTSGGKNVYPEELEDAFQLYYDIQQITVRGYYKEGDETSEEIEALIYPADDLYKRLGYERNNDFVQEEVFEAIEKIVHKVNKQLQSYEQITKITLLKEPLEMTPSQKVKRNFIPKAYVIIKKGNKKESAM